MLLMLLQLLNYKIIVAIDFPGGKRNVKIRAGGERALKRQCISFGLSVMQSGVWVQLRRTPTNVNKYGQNIAQPEGKPICIAL